MSDQTEKKDYESLRKLWEEEVENNPKTQSFLEPYKQSDCKDLYRQYAFNKMLAYQNADYYRKHNESRQNQWIYYATRHLAVIQQKKLFDAQCRWRAGQEVFEGVEICYDFKILEKNVMSCNFLEEPNSYDIDLYCQYLIHDSSFEWYYNDYSSQWQDYSGFKASYVGQMDEGNNLPAWYEFHNSRTGNGALLILPDLRGQLERQYRDLARAEKIKNSPPAPPYTPPPDADKPYLNYYDKTVHLELARQIENKEMFNMIREYVEATEHKGSWEYERAQESFTYLSDIKDELIPIEAHQDFRMALISAENKYRAKKIAEHLPIALELYHTNKKLQEIGISTYQEESDSSFDIHIRQIYADDILLGRKLSGEPEDFNF